MDDAPDARPESDPTPPAGAPHRSAGSKARAEIRGTYLREVNRPIQRRRIPTTLGLLILALLLAVLVLAILELWR